MTILFLFSVAVLRMPWQRKFEWYRFWWLTIPSYSLQKCQGCRNWNRWSYHIFREAGEQMKWTQEFQCSAALSTTPQSWNPAKEWPTHSGQVFPSCYAIKIIPTGVPRGQSSSRFCQVDNQHWPSPQQNTMEKYPLQIQLTCERASCYPSSTSSDWNKWFGHRRNKNLEKAHKCLPPLDQELSIFLLGKG